MPLSALFRQGTRQLELTFNLPVTTLGPIVANDLKVRTTGLSGTHTLFSKLGEGLILITKHNAPVPPGGSALVTYASPQHWIRGQQDQIVADFTIIPTIVL